MIGEPKGRTFAGYRFKRRREDGRWRWVVYACHVSSDGSYGSSMNLLGTNHAGDTLAHESKDAARAWARARAQVEGVTFAEYDHPKSKKPEPLSPDRAALGKIGLADQVAASQERQGKWAYAIETWAQSVRHCLSAIAVVPGRRVWLKRAAKARLDRLTKCAAKWAEEVEQVPVALKLIGAPKP